MSGVTAIRATVKAFGRFTRWASGSGQRLEHELAHGAQRLEHSVAGDGDGLEIWRMFHPLARSELLHQVLARMRRVRGDALPRGLGHLPPGVERRLELPHRG